MIIKGSIKFIISELKRLTPTKMTGLKRVNGEWQVTLTEREPCKPQY